MLILHVGIYLIMFKTINKDWMISLIHDTKEHLLDIDGVIVNPVNPETLSPFKNTLSTRLVDDYTYIKFQKSSRTSLNSYLEFMSVKYDIQKLQKSN